MTKPISSDPLAYKPNLYSLIGYGTQFPVENKKILKMYTTRTKRKGVLFPFYTLSNLSPLLKCA
jgi:hypothetical protein